jgi:hypothetical protein
LRCRHVSIDIDRYLIDGYRFLEMAGNSDGLKIFQGVELNFHKTLRPAFAKASARQVVRKY